LKSLHPLLPEHSPELLEMLYLFVFTHYPTQNRFALLLEMPRLYSTHCPTQNRFALLLEMLCPYLRIVRRKTASHFCWKCSVLITHCPTQNRFALLLEML